MQPKNNDDCLEKRQGELGCSHLKFTRLRVTFIALLTASLETAVDDCTMENISTENSEVDGGGRHVSEYCLQIPTILRLVLENCSTRALVRLSLVNKLWNYEARSVMRDRGNIRASIYPGGSNEHDLRQKIVAFASYLERMNVVPFIGLHIFIYHNHDGVCQSFSEGSLDLPFKVILDRLPWKHFSVKFCYGWDKCKDCAAVMLTKRILEERIEVLEELHLAHATEAFLRPIFEDRSLPRLKSLTIESHDFENSLPSDYVKVLVSCAPNLQELHADGFVNLEVNVLEGSSAVLVPYQFRFDPLSEQYCEDLMKSLRARRMEIIIGEADPALLGSFLPLVLQASRTTLTDLRMDLLFAVPLMCYGVCLENVTKLEIRLLNSEFVGDIEKPILELPKGLDFTRVFPKLKAVTIGDGSSLGFPSDVISAYVEQGKAVLSRALPDRATNIKTLDIGRIYFVGRSTLQLLAQIFPDVRKLRTKSSQKLPFTLLEEYFLCLEKVKGSLYDSGL